MQPDCNVVIVGAGPVGLFLACCLQSRNIRCTVLERRQKPIDHSRSIGIHPVSLELFANLGLVERFLAAGHRIRSGHVYIEQTRIGTLEFAVCAPPYQFILALPQYLTEKILQNHVRNLAGTTLIRDAIATDYQQDETGVSIRYHGSDGNESQVHADFLIGCDGKSSGVRTASGIAFPGGHYTDTYIMGDFSENTDYSSDAAIYLHRDGLIESFPLPDQRRRWVVKTDTLMHECRVSDITRCVYNRLGHNLTGCANFMVNAFGVQHYQAESFVKGRVALAGDAAHIVSPIGGQGMNLGWLDAWALTEAIAAIAHGAAYQSAFRRYQEKRVKAARKARRRAEFNMVLGRSTLHPRLRNGAARAIVYPLLNRIMANMFTMRGLDTWPL